MVLTCSVEATIEQLLGNTLCTNLQPPGVMTTRNTESGTPCWNRRLPTVLLLLVLIGVIAAARLHTYQEPLDRDLHVYAVAAHEFLQGRALYADIWDHKPPAIHITYAAAEMCAGYGPAAIYLLTVGAAGTTLIGLYAVGRVAGRTGGVWAAVFWTAISGILGLQANQPNVEVFMNACLVGAFALLVRDTWSSGSSWIVGLLLAVGTLYKQIVLIPALGWYVVHVLFPPEGYNRRQALADGLRAALVGAAAWLAVIGSFWFSGHFADYWAATVSYNRLYAGSLGTNLCGAFDPARLLPDGMRLLLPLAAAGWLAVGLCLSRQPRRGMLLLAWAVSIPLMIAAPGKERLFPHYYQLWLPWLAGGAGWAVGILYSANSGAGRGLAQAGAAILLFLVVRQEAPHYRLPAEEWSRRKYGEIFVASDRIARELASLLQPGETFYQWGAEPGLYAVSGRRPPAGVFYLYPLLDPGPLAAHLSCRVLTDLEREQPELLVLWKDYLPGADGHPVYDWCLRHYQPLPANADRGPCLFYCRRGGSLAERLGKESHE